MVQLFAGDALLPRFVVLRQRGRARALVRAVLRRSPTTPTRAASERDRVLVVATADELESLEAELARAPGAPGARRELAHAGRGGVDERPADADRSLDAAAIAARDRRRAQPRRAGERRRRAAGVDCSTRTGVRIRTLSLFYEQWLGKLPIGELERVSLLFDIGEVHAAWYARVKRLLDVGLGAVRARSRSSW